MFGIRFMKARKDIQKQTVVKQARIETAGLSKVAKFNYKDLWVFVKWMNVLHLFLLAWHCHHQSILKLRTTLPRIPLSVSFCIRICQRKNLHEIWKTGVKQKLFCLEQPSIHTCQAFKRLLKVLLLSRSGLQTSQVAAFFLCSRAFIYVTVKVSPGLQL